ncbi:GNAT family N-acetyltransferase [Acinetobacter sp. B5B]|uniref:GNAT family N-acetyltransferase n=1 Tax=Acinetobacter baretiae TaxID=2605383 RepID=UPI0018C218BC|nr:GNAT family N-acetyltransferase [Acinetobacter baretiae]MBF7681975.1 GNAT family N-acetyltransferase [Acinetobacter baretiae]MBF7684231.1 GNAT family N-acetyltransferase [Acinetobacter baretiae]
MSFVQPVQLSKHGVLLEPLTHEHLYGLTAACQDGELWKIRVTSTPKADEVKQYINTACNQGLLGHRFAFAVIEKDTGQVIGTTSYHDILADVKRVEIGYTWYAQSVQRTHVNTTCKLLLLEHAFETLNCNTVAFRTDIFNFKSQRAIERLGAKKDGIIRGNAFRKDNTIRDTVMYSISSSEWPDIKAHITDLLSRHGLNA